VADPDTAWSPSPTERRCDGRAPATGEPGPDDAADKRFDDALTATFETDLAEWLAWLYAARARRADLHAMRRLELVYGVGWVAVIVAGLAIPVFGTAAAVLGLSLVVVTMVLGRLASAPRRDDPDALARASWVSLLGPQERPRLMRIMNLSRVAGRPAAAALLLDEVDDALSSDGLRTWRPLRDLRELLRANPAWLPPFSETV